MGQPPIGRVRGTVLGAQEEELVPNVRVPRACSLADLRRPAYGEQLFHPAGTGAPCSSPNQDMLQLVAGMSPFCPATARVTPNRLNSMAPRCKRGTSSAVVVVLGHRQMIEKLISKRVCLAPQQLRKFCQFFVESGAFVFCGVAAFVQGREAQSGEGLDGFKLRHVGTQDVPC